MEIIIKNNEMQKIKGLIEYLKLNHDSTKEQLNYIEVVTKHETEEIPYKHLECIVTNSFSLIKEIIKLSDFEEYESGLTYYLDKRDLIDIPTEFYKKPPFYTLKIKLEETIIQTVIDGKEKKYIIENGKNINYPNVKSIIPIKKPQRNSENTVVLDINLIQHLLKSRVNNKDRVIHLTIEENKFKPLDISNEPDRIELIMPIRKNQ